jgi:hypothetical protein
MKMIGIKEAAGTAKRYLVDLIGQVFEIRLEEVESNEQDWLITLSYLEDPNPAWSSRLYKIFTINKASGEVTSMKIRNVQSA